MEFQRESTPENSPLKRWKSLGFLNVSRDSSVSPSSKSKFSESSIEICYIYDSDSSVDGKPSLEDSGIYDRTCHQDVLLSLEHKIDKLSEIIQEQSNQLAVLQERAQETVSTAVQKHAQLVADTIATVLTQKLELPLNIDLTEAGEGAVSEVHTGAKALLDALESKKLASVDQYIKTALTEFLQSKELCDLLVTSTTASIHALIEQHFAGDVTASYLPLLEKAQRRLLRQTTAHLDEAFKEIEAHATNFSKTTFKTARFIRQNLERHQRLVENSTADSERVAWNLRESVTGIIQQELKQFREQALSVIQEKEPAFTPTPLSPLPRMISVSPPQPIEPGRSAIDQLMSAAEINNKMKDGDVNGSFERALSASDLALVMAACRAADPARVFAPPCQLKQHVIMSLIQQLATDMVHETQLKCRYLEDSLMNLDTEDPVISKHLKSVVEGVCSHLSMFLKNYPSHMSSRRIQMFIMAAGSLVNKEHVFNHPIRTTYVS